MPCYDFECQECKKVYDDLANYDETEVYLGVFCPHCKSDKKKKLMSCCAAMPNKGSHDYRFYSKIDGDRGIRQRAEEAHGDGGYRPIDDISSGHHFGEVK